MYLRSQSTVHHHILPILMALFAIILPLCRAASIPLPDVCWEGRGDQNVPDSVSSNCESYDKVRRFFFHPSKHCKKFGLCPSAATHLDQDSTRDYNYFQSLAECENACTNAVECPLEPLQEIDNGHPFPGDIEGRLGYGMSVTFECNEGYRLVQETTRTCQLNATWDGVQPYCEIQCPRPESLAQNISISPLQQYYNVGQSVKLDCMDGLYGNTTWTCRDQGTWDGPAPTCSRDCAPQVIDNAHPPEIFHNGQTVTYSYRCYNGYSLLYNNSSLSCTNGQLQGKTPICTRVQIRKADGTALTSENGTFHFVMVQNAENQQLTCGLEGLEQHRYTVNWTLPKKPNGEVPPGISVSSNSIHFNRALPEVHGTYNCAIAGISVSIIVEVTSGQDPPNVYYLHPTNTIKSLRGETKTIVSLTSGSRPIYVTWQHNGSRVVNNNSDSQFTVMEFDTDSIILSQLTIHNVDETTQGTYKVVADNGVESSSQEVQLMLAQQEEGSRGKREAPFCDRDPRKVVLAGVVRRTGRSEAGLRTIRLRVDRVLRGDACGITRRSVNIHVLPETDSSRLRRGQSVILSGVATGKAVFSFGAPIEDYSNSLEKAILEC